MVNKKLSKLNKPQQVYYIFVAKECFAGFSNAEDNFNIYRYASCNAWLFHSSEFFWKALTVLSGNYFNPSHEASQADLKKIASDILSDDDKIKVIATAYNFPLGFDGTGQTIGIIKLGGNYTKDDLEM